MIVFLRNCLAVVVALIGLFLVMPAVLLALPVWLVATLTSLLANVLQPRHAPWKELIEFDPIAGWRPKPNLDTHYMALGDDVCHVATDGEGWPGRNHIAESDVIVFGDSFAFGYGVDLSDSFIELNPELRVKSISSPGYNMVQEVVLMRRMQTRLQNKLVIWFICLENDLFDNLRPDKPNFYRTPFVRNCNGTGDWEIVTTHLKRAKWPYPTLKRPYGLMFAKLCTPGPLADHTYSACDFLIREANQICTRQHASLAVVTVPNKNQLSEKGLQNIWSQLPGRDGFDPDLPDRRIGRICQKLNVSFVAAKNRLAPTDYKDYDVHWTESGHQRIAELVSELFDAYKVGELSSLLPFWLALSPMIGYA